MVKKSKKRDRNAEQSQACSLTKIQAENKMT